MKRVTAILAVLILATALAPPITAATIAPPRASFSDVEDELMCVTCGVPLPLAESPQATQERAQIRRDIAAGMTKEKIKADMVSIYSDRVLAQPKSSGFGLAVYLVPIAIVLAGLALIAVLVPRWRRRRGDGTPADGGPSEPGPLAEADAARLDADLARYEL